MTAAILTLYKPGGSIKRYRNFNFLPAHPLAAGEIVASDSVLPGRHVLRFCRLGRLWLCLSRYAHPDCLKCDLQGAVLRRRDHAVPALERNHRRGKCPTWNAPGDLRWFHSPKTAVEGII